MYPQKGRHLHSWWTQALSSSLDLKMDQGTADGSHMMTTAPRIQCVRGLTRRYLDQAEMAHMATPLPRESLSVGFCQ